MSQAAIMRALSTLGRRSSERPARRRLGRFARPVGHGLVVAGLLFGAYLFLIVAPTTQTVGFDAFAYWSVDLADPYAIPVGALGSFNYSPPVALVAGLFGAVDWWVFLFLWTMLLVGTIIWIAGSPTWILAAFAFPFVTLELYHGNIHILLAAAIVLGFRHPWTWAFVLLAKPTAGVGLLWFVVRRERRPLAIALGTTALISLVSLAVAPSLWMDWIDLLLRGAGAVPGNVHFPIPLWFRLPAAALLVIWGACTDRRWTVVVSSMLALPVLWFAAPAMLIGVVPDLRDRAHRAEEQRHLPSSILWPIAIVIGAIAIIGAIVIVAREDQSAGLATLEATTVDPVTLPQTVPFRYVAGHIVIDVTLGDDSRTVPMILDSGTPSIVAPELAEVFAGEPAGSVSTASADGQVTSSAVVSLPRLRIGGAEFRDVGALESAIEPGNPLYCLSDAGFIGASLMKEAAWQIDYAAREVTIADGVAGLDHIESAIRLDFEPASAVSPSPLIELPAGEGTLTFVVDTGSDGWLVVNPADLEAAGVEFAPDAPAIAVLATGAGGLFVTRLAYVAADLSLGDRVLPAVPVATSVALPQGQGNLGNEFLVDFVVTIDWTEGAIYLDPADPDRIGAELRPADPLSATVTWRDGYVLGSFVEGLPSSEGLVLGAPVEAIDGEDVTSATFDDFCARSVDPVAGSSDLTLSGDPPTRIRVVPVEGFHASS